ncbi:MAG: ADP-ribosylglycohydrolase family protein [Bacteroidota bacterium]
MKDAYAHDLLVGIAIGDAIGVPVEFTSKEERKALPVKDMQAFGTHNQPAGTWSDDTSLTLCLAEAILTDFSLRHIADQFIAWRDQAFWTAHGEVFDIGISTNQAILRLKDTSLPPELAGGMEEMDNGNGSLMRIAPLSLLIKDLELNDRYSYNAKVSSLTHGHFRSIFSCFFLNELLLQLGEGKGKREAYEEAIFIVQEWIGLNNPSPEEITHFDSILSGRIDQVAESDIRGSGYVLHSLQASLWCWLKTDNYEDAVLMAVNLGEDTDTTGAITGAIAGVTYGLNSIPKKWVDQLARKRDIIKLADRLQARFIF